MIQLVSTAEGLVTLLSGLIQIPKETQGESSIDQATNPSVLPLEGGRATTLLGGVDSHTLFIMGQGRSQLSHVEQGCAERIVGSQEATRVAEALGQV
jgi:hypothetical protein